jgi:hypothetical protein
MIAFLFSHQILVSGFLLFGDLLATFAVAYGIVLETPEDPDARQRRAVKFVIAGVVLETMFSLGLFAFDQLVMSAQGTDIQTLAAVAGRAETAATNASNRAAKALHNVDVVSRKTNDALATATKAADLGNRAASGLSALGVTEATLRRSLGTDETHICEIDSWRRALAADLKWRDVSDADKAKIAAALKGHHFQHQVWIYFLQDIDETFFYPLAIAFALGAGGVDSGLDPVGWARKPPGSPSFPSPINPLGVTIYEFPGTGSQGDAATLQSALGAGGITANIERPTSAIPGTPPLAIFVGRKQNPFFQIPDFLGFHPKMKAIIRCPNSKPH